MPEETNVATMESQVDGDQVDVNEEEGDDEVQNKVEKPYGFLELVSFGPKTQLAGFSFYQRQYKSVDDAIAHVEGLKPGKGKETILALLNNALSAASRTKATAGAPMDSTGKTPVEIKEKTKALRASALAKGENLLITEEEAEKYIPGTRERYALTYFQRKYQEARKRFTENKTEENKQAFLKARQELMDAQEKDMLETLAEPVPAPTAQAA